MSFESRSAVAVRCNGSRFLFFSVWHWSSPMQPTGHAEIRTTSTSPFPNGHCSITMGGVMPSA